MVCAQPLFSSDTKYDSGCGWPAFNDVLDKGRVKLSPDTSGGKISVFKIRDVNISFCNLAIIMVDLVCQFLVKFVLCF